MNTKNFDKQKEFETQEIMQYAISIIDRFGFKKRKEYNSPYIRLMSLLTDFDFYSKKYKALEGVELKMEDIQLDSNKELAEEVLDYFSNKEIKDDSQFIEADKRRKGIALNMYCIENEFATICYMYNLYCKIKHIGAFDNKKIA